MENILSDFLRQKREEAGLSQGDVSRKLKYSTPQFVSNWERGLSSPPLKVLKQVAEMYRVPSDQLFEMILEYSICHLKKNMVKEYQRTVKKKTKLRVS